MHFAKDDRDELFRKAGREYELNTQSADWQKINSLLSSRQELPLCKIASWNFHWLWLLLLLPALWLCNKQAAKTNKIPFLKKDSNQFVFDNDRLLNFKQTTQLVNTD